MEKTTVPSNACVSGKKLGQAVCAALGLDSQSVMSLTLELPGSGVALVQVKLLVREQAGQGLVEQLSSYRLVEKMNPILNRPLTPPEREHGFLFLSDEQVPVSALGSPSPQARLCPGSEEGGSPTQAPGSASG